MHFNLHQLLDNWPRPNRAQKSRNRHENSWIRSRLQPNWAICRGQIDAICICCHLTIRKVGYTIPRAEALSFILCFYISARNLVPFWYLFNQFNSKPFKMFICNLNLLSARMNSVWFFYFVPSLFYLFVLRC